MRCSSSEAQLDAFVEGELSPLRRARVAEHVASCASCGGLLEELRVIDALLIAPRRLEPAPNFTFKLMAEVRALPRPQAHRAPLAAILATYIVFGWVAIAAFLFLDGAAARATLGALQLGSVRFGATLGAISAATGHLFGRQTFDVTAAMGGILALDLVVAAAGVAFYTVLRARRAAVETRSEPC